MCIGCGGSIDPNPSHPVGTSYYHPTKYDNIKFSNIDVNKNYVSIKGEITYKPDIVQDQVKTEKVKDILYISVYSGYGASEELKKFTLEKQFEGEEIKQIILRCNNKKDDVVIWNKSVCPDNRWVFFSNRKAGKYQTPIGQRAESRHSCNQDQSNLSLSLRHIQRKGPIDRK